MKNESALLLCGSSQLIRVEEITYTRQVMIHNSTSAWRLLGEEAPAWSHSEWSESTRVVSIPGSLCPCNGMEFWFYLIGGSHPLFRTQAQTDTRSSIIPGELVKLCSLLSLSFALSFLLLPLFFLYDCLPPTLWYSSTSMRSADLDKCVYTARNLNPERCEKRKRVMESDRREKRPQMNILCGSASGSPSLVNFLSGCSIIHARTPNVWCLHAAGESVGGWSTRTDTPSPPITYASSQLAATHWDSVASHGDAQIKMLIRGCMRDKIAFSLCDCFFFVCFYI